MTKDNNRLGQFELSGIPPAPRGVPQIEVSFDVDANGILNVSAKDKSTGKSNSITITNDKGRLSKEDIDKMVADAEKYKKEDDAQRERVAAKNSLESYAYNVKSTVEQQAVEDKLNEEDRRVVVEKAKEVLKWLDCNSLAEKEEFEEKEKDLQRVCSPIMSKLHGGKTGGVNGQSGNCQTGPNVEEVD